MLRLLLLAAASYGATTIQERRARHSKADQPWLQNLRELQNANGGLDIKANVATALNLPASSDALASLLDAALAKRLTPVDHLPAPRPSARRRTSTTAADHALPPIFFDYASPSWQPEQAFDALHFRGVAVIDSFFADSADVTIDQQQDGHARLLTAMQASAERLRKAGAFGDTCGRSNIARSVAIGVPVTGAAATAVVNRTLKQEEKQKDKETLTKPGASGEGGLKLLSDRLTTLRQALQTNSAALKGVNTSSDISLSCYGPLASYGPHLDARTSRTAASATDTAGHQHSSQQRGDSGWCCECHGRKVSFIFYLNQDWDAARLGGELRVQLLEQDDDKEQCTASDTSHKCHSRDALPTVDIAPTAGRLVLLLSQAVHHEVLPVAADAGRHRFALNGFWERR